MLSRVVRQIYKQRFMMLQLKHLSKQLHELVKIKQHNSF